jgi:hypothetical protein
VYVFAISLVAQSAIGLMVLQMQKNSIFNYVTGKGEGKRGRARESMRAKSLSKHM